MVAIEQIQPHNRLLDSLSPRVRELIAPHLKPVDLQLHDVVAERGHPIADVYFPTTCLLSVVAEMESGQVIEATLAGNDGFAPLGALFGVPASNNTVVTQVAGTALRMPIDAFLALAPDLGFRNPLGAFTILSQDRMMQSTGCIAFHPVEQRLARWLLMVKDAMETETFEITHEFIGVMLGVHRPTVTVAVGTLVRAGLIEQTRGRVRIADVEGLEAASCECYFAQRQLAGHRA